MESELHLDVGVGVTAWLTAGLKIQEAQFVSSDVCHILV
jgi:hypothetical protein